MTETSAGARNWIELEDQFSAHNYHPLDIILTRGEGVWVWDVDDNRYLDCLAAYSAVNQGHNPIRKAKPPIFIYKSAERSATANPCALETLVPGRRTMQTRSI